MRHSRLGVASVAALLYDIGSLWRGGTLSIQIPVQYFSLQLQVSSVLQHILHTPYI
jgi:hypothetical protein